MTYENKINKLVKEELTAMCIKHKQEKFNSPHEAWAVTLEEVEEAESDMAQVRIFIDEVKFITFHDSDYRNERFKLVRKYALHAIQELIQVCACCDKAVRE